MLKIIKRVRCTARNPEEDDGHGFWYTEGEIFHQKFDDEESYYPVDRFDPTNPHNMVGKIGLPIYYLQRESVEIEPIGIREDPYFCSKISEFQEKLKAKQEKLNALSKEIADMEEILREADRKEDTDVL